MTEIPGMIIWTGDYLADTGHLTTFEHGAYLLILMAMWRNGGKLPKDSKQLALIAKVAPMHWRHVEKNLMNFMMIEKEPDGTEYITQKRLITELNLALIRHKKREVAGRLGGTAKALKRHIVESSNGTAMRVAKGTDCYPITITNIKKESLNGGKRQEGIETAKLVFINEDTPQWEAWSGYWFSTKGHRPNKTQRKGTLQHGWYFPAEWPPTGDLLDGK